MVTDSIETNLNAKIAPNLGILLIVVSIITLPPRTESAQPGCSPSFSSIPTNHPGFSPMTTMVASLNLNIDSNWYPDSDARNYLTNNFNNLFT
ncbi:hypothetical protein Csa_020007, partial [Cucumis sativus]